MLQGQSRCFRSVSVSLVCIGLKEPLFALMQLLLNVFRQRRQLNFNEVILVWRSVPAHHKRFYRFLHEKSTELADIVIFRFHTRFMFTHLVWEWPTENGSCNMYSMGRLHAKSSVLRGVTFFSATFSIKPSEVFLFLKLGWAEKRSFCCVGTISGVAKFASPVVKSTIPVTAVTTAQESAQMRTWRLYRPLTYNVICVRRSKRYVWQWLFVCHSTHLYCLWVTDWIYLLQYKIKSSPFEKS